MDEKHAGKVYDMAAKMREEMMKETRITIFAKDLGRQAKELYLKGQHENKP